MQSCFKDLRAFPNMQGYGLRPEQTWGLENAVASAYFHLPPLRSLEPSMTGMSLGVSGGDEAGGGCM